MKQKLFWIGITAILLSYAGNYIYYLSKQLDEPIILKHYYYRQYIPSFDIEFPIYYITNKSEPLSISHVEIEGVDARVQYSHGLVSWMYDSQVHYFSEYDHYYLMEASITISTNPYSLELQENENWSFNDMTVYFSNGESLTVNIGEVIVSNKKIANDQSDSPIFFHSGIGTRNYVVRTGEAQQPFTIENVNSSFWDILENQIKIKISSTYESSNNKRDTYIRDLDDVDWDAVEGNEVTNQFSPIHIEAKEWVELIMFYNDLTSVVEVPIIFSGTIENDEPFEFSTWIYSQPAFNQEVINEIIESEKKVKNNE